MSNVITYRGGKGTHVIGSLGIVPQYNMVTTSALVNDTFTDSNGTNITAHTPDVDASGGGWSYSELGFLAGTVEIQSNKADFIDAAANQVIFKIDPTQDNIVYSADINNAHANQTDGFLVKYNNGLANYTISWRGKNLLFIEFNGGFVTRAATVTTNANTGSYTITGTRSGTTADGTVNDGTGDFTVSYSSMTGAGEEVGFFTEAESASLGSTYDNVLITAGA